MLNANKTKYYYEDSHLYFWFGNHHSSEYKLFIVSNNDLTIENTVGSSTEYEDAMFQEGIYLLGTNRKQKTFKRKVASEGLSLDAYHNMMAWLSEGETGFLCFDSNPYWGWTVVLEKVGDATVYYTSQGLIVEFELTWKTVGSDLATNRYTSMGIYDVPSSTENYVITSGNPYGLPSFVKVTDSVTSFVGTYQFYDIINIGNHSQQIDFYAKHSPSVANYTFDLQTVKKQGTTNKATQYATAQLTNLATVDLIIKYHGGSNLIFINGALAEEHESFATSSQPNGLLTLSGPPPKEITTSVTSQDWSSLELQGYKYIISVDARSSATWGTTPFPSSSSMTTGTTTDLASVLVHIYSDTDLTNGLTYNSTYRYYAVSATRIAVKGGGTIGTTLQYLGKDANSQLNYRVRGPGDVALTVHNYNNL